MSAVHSKRKVNLKMVIVDHYDQLINQIDIYTEELLCKIDENQFVQDPGPYLGDEKFSRYKELLHLQQWEESKRLDKGIHDELHHYREEYQQDQLKDNDNPFEHMPRPIKAHDYVHLVRQRLLDEIRLAQETNLSNLMRQREALALCEDEELKKRLFDGKFCFLVVIDWLPSDYYWKLSNKDKNQSIFKMYMFVLDFYMTKEETAFFEKILNFHNEPYHRPDRIRMDLDKRTMLVYLLYNFTNLKLLKTPKLGNELIRVDKKTLMSVQKADFNQDLIGIVNLRLNGPKFGFLKSLVVDGLYHDLKSIELQGLTNLEHLAIRGAALYPEIFAGMKNLRCLYLFDCKLAHLDQALVHVPNLEHIFISFLYQLEVDFSPLRKLQHVELRSFHPDFDFNSLATLNNQISFLGLRGFSDCKKSNELGNVLPSFSQLRELDLGSNWFDKIDKRFFASLLNLKVLNVPSCGLKVLRPSYWRHLGHLESLSLEPNQIMLLGHDAFAGLDNLKSLSLERNPINFVDPQAFQGVKNLQKLIFTCTEAFASTGRLTAEFLNNLDSLTELDLRYNKIQSIDRNVFAQLPSLKKLSLKDNRLKIDSMTFKYNLSNLRELDLSINHLRTLEENTFSALENLDTLLLAYNELENLNARWFTGLVKLKNLDLDYNKILLNDFYVDVIRQMLQTMPRIECLRLKYQERPLESANQLPYMSLPTYLKRVVKI